MIDYTNYNDYELLDFIAENNEDANDIMYKKYKPLIVKTAKNMLKYNKYPGLDLNDLIQEGMLGLSKAIDSFDDQGESSFYTYAKLCIERKIISSLISTSRLKSKLLNESISIDTSNNIIEGKNIEYLFKSNNSNPENILLSEEKIDSLMNIAIDTLTDFELQVFQLKVNGFEYKEIAEILDKDKKAIDNAIQRIKIKLRKVLT